MVWYWYRRLKLVSYISELRHVYLFLEEISVLWPSQNVYLGGKTKREMNILREIFDEFALGNYLKVRIVTTANVFPLCIKWACRAFLTASRLLRMSSSGIRITSLIECPAWLKCKETGVGWLSCWWFKMDRRCSPNRSFSWRLVSPMYWHLHLLH